MYTITDLYDLDHTLAADYLRQFTYPWEALKGIKELILRRRRFSPRLTSARPALSGPGRKCATALSSAARRLSARTAW